MRLLPVRTASERASKGREEGENPKPQTEDDSNDPRPIAAAAATEGEGGEGEGGGDDLSFFVTIFSYVFPMTGAGKRERRETREQNYMEKEGE